MFENINDENVVEQTFENEKDSGSEISVVDTPTTSTDNPGSKQELFRSFSF